MPDDIRNKFLMPFITRLGGTTDTPEIEGKRAAFMIIQISRRMIAKQLSALSLPSEGFANAQTINGVRVAARDLALALALARARALDRALDLDRALARALALALALDLDRALDRALALARALDRDLAVALALDLALDRASDRDLDIFIATCSVYMEAIQ